MIHNKQKITERNHKIAIIGLGYVGLPLAVEFAKKFKVIGFDINTLRVAELSSGVDNTLEVSSADLKRVLLEKKENALIESAGLITSSDIKDIASANIFIITVPTPIDEHKKPDLSPLLAASKMIGEILKIEEVTMHLPKVIWKI